jgi:hypothetical protein
MRSVPGFILNLLASVGYLSGQREPAVNRLRKLRRFESFPHHNYIDVIPARPMVIVPLTVEKREPRKACPSSYQGRHRRRRIFDWESMGG